MTNESRRAFERHYEGDYEGNLQRYGSHENDDYIDDDLDNKWRGWQASEARILALLDSSEFLEFMVEKLIYKTSAQDLIEAIKQRINKGE